MGRSLLVLAVLAAAAILAGLAVQRPGRADGATRGNIRGWPWLVAGVGMQVLWVRFLSLHTAPPPALRWLPCLALLPALRFLWLNRQYRGLWVLAAGAGLNLLVMAGNGGLMPISPGNLHAIGSPPSHTGMALAHSKDRVLGDGMARFAALDDRVVVSVAGIHVAGSPGDLLVLAGCVITLAEELWRSNVFSRNAAPARTAQREAAPEGSL